MTHPYITNSQAWCHALRVQMGYPPYAPGFHTTSWCASGPRNIFEVMQISQIAADMGRDIVHVAFQADAAEPVGVSLAIRQNAGIEWLPGCRLYAASESSRIELLARDRRWFVGPRQVLTSAKLPPKGRRERGEEIAMRRWRQAASTMPPLELTDSVWVRPGERYADRIAMEDLRIAA